MTSTRGKEWLEPHVTPRQAAVGVVLIIAVVTAVGLLHHTSSRSSGGESQSTPAASASPAPLAGDGGGLGAQDRAAASATASEFVWAAIATLDAPPGIQRLAVRPYDTDSLDTALASSPLSSDLTAVPATARVDGVALLVAQRNGVDARVTVSSASATGKTTVALTLRPVARGWRVDDVLAS